MALPLDGIKVLDFTDAEQGPCATQVLGDFGADIIKVERVGRGSNHRYSLLINGVGAYFLALNRNKKSLSINLQTEEGKKIIHQIVERCDVVVNNFRPGVMDRLGLGYQDLCQINPRIIFASASGYGQQGPYRAKKGQDLIAQAMGGVMSITGAAGDPPTPCGTWVADWIGGMILAQGILLALYHRERTGEGQEVETCLLNGQVASQLQEATWYLNTGKLPQRGLPGSGHADNPTTYGVYRTKDGYIALSGRLSEICEIVGLPNMEENPKYDTREKQFAYQHEIRPLLAEKFLQQPSTHWLKLLEERDILCGPVNTYAEVFNDPQVLLNEMVIEIDHPNGGKYKTSGLPLKMSKTPGKVRIPPPLLGQHTDEILTDLGYSSEAIQNLREAKVVG